MLRVHWQVPLGKPKVVPGPCPLNLTRYSGSSTLNSSSLAIHQQLWWWGLVSQPDLWRAGVARLQIFHISKLGESGEVWGDFHSDSVPATSGKFLALQLVVVTASVMFCTEQNKISHLEL